MTTQGSLKVPIRHTNTEYAIRMATQGSLKVLIRNTNTEYRIQTATQRCTIQNTNTEYAVRKATQGYPKVQYRIRIQITLRLSSQQPHIPLQELRNTNTQYAIQKCGQTASFQAIHTCPYAGPSTKCDAVHTKYENHLKKGGWLIRKWAGEYGAENTKCKLYSTRLYKIQNTQITMAATTTEFRSTPSVQI